jgi:hypothetical protein
VRVPQRGRSDLISARRVIVPPTQKGLGGLSQAFNQPVKPYEGSHDKEQKLQVLERGEFAALLGQGHIASR